MRECNCLRASTVDSIIHIWTLKTPINDIKIIYNTMTFYEILSEFILSLTMPGAKEGEEQ